MFSVVLSGPEIPRNMGDVVHTCMVTGTWLRLIKSLGSDVGNKATEQADLGYRHLVDIRVYENLGDFFQKAGVEDIWSATTKALGSHTEAVFRDGCYLVFEKGTAGLPEAFRRARADRCVRIPIQTETWYLNLSSATAVLTYEAPRQFNLSDLTGGGAMGGKALRTIIRRP